MNIEKNKQIAPQVVLAQHGNKSAFKSLYLAYYKNIFFICKLMTGDVVAAMTKQVKELGYMFVLTFFCFNFLALLTYSGVGSYTTYMGVRSILALNLVCD